MQTVYRAAIDLLETEVDLAIEAYIYPRKVSMRVALHALEVAVNEAGDLLAKVEELKKEIEELNEYIANDTMPIRH